MLDSSISEFTKTNSATIRYEVHDRTSIKMQCVRFGIEHDIHYFPISETTTVEDICRSNELENQLTANSLKRVLRMKNGIIICIVQPKVKLFSLIDDGFDYRLDEYTDTTIDDTGKSRRFT